MAVFGCKISMPRMHSLAFSRIHLMNIRQANKKVTLTLFPVLVFFPDLPLVGIMVGISVGISVGMVVGTGSSVGLTVMVGPRLDGD